MGQGVLPTMKTCKKCNIEFPATAEYFYKHTTTKDRLRNDCKTCLLKSNYDRVKLWKKKYPEKDKEHTRQAHRKYISIKQGLIHEDWTEKQLIDAYGANCYLCNNPIDLSLSRIGNNSDYSLWPDHVIPRSMGGENTIRNVRPCHAMCNRSKHNKTYEEYMLKVNSQDIVIGSLS